MLVIGWLNSTTVSTAGMDVGANTDLAETATKLQVHDVVLVKLLQAFVEIIPKHGSVCDEACGRHERLLELLPHDVLAWIRRIRILGEQREVLH